MMPTTKIEGELLKVAEEFYKEGPGWAQEAPVLREAARRLGIGTDLRSQQEVLNCWHKLFREGRLLWGYDLDNPRAPFFHLPELVQS